MLIVKRVLEVNKDTVCFLPEEALNTDDFVHCFALELCTAPIYRTMNSKPMLTPEIVETALKSFQNWRAAIAYFHWASDQQGYSHSCYTYNAMAAVLSDARQIAPLRELAENIPKSRSTWTPGAFGYFLRCLGSQGLVKEANSLFDQMKISGLCSLNCYSYNCLLEVIAKGGDIDLLKHRLIEMRNFGCPVDKYVLTPMLQCCCNAGKLDDALNVFNEMKERGWVDQHVLGILVLSYSKMGEVNTAFELIEWAEKDLKICLNEKTMCVLIHGFVREQRVDKALELYDKMKEIGHLPNIAVYGALISSLCKNKETRKAITLCAHMKQSGILPDVRIITQILSCLDEEVDMMVQFLKNCFMDLDASKRRLLYSSVLTDLVKCGYVFKAYHLLKETMRSGGNENILVGNIDLIKEKPDITCFETVVDGLCTADKIDMALDLFNDMDQNGCKRSVLLFNNLICCLSNADRLSDCVQLLNQMKGTEFEPTHFTFNCILGCLCRREDVSGVLDLLREIRACGHEPWIKNYTLLVTKLCEHGKVAEAFDFLSEMRKIGFLPDMVAYSATIDGFINKNDLDQGLKLFRELCERGHCPDVVAYNTVIKGLCRAQRITEAKDILKEMLGKGLTPSVVTYNSLIDGLCKAGDIDQAILYFSRMREKAREPNIITYTTLVDGLCNNGKPDDALKLWSEMEHNGCHPNRIAYMALINGLCKCQKPDVALAYLQKMEEKEWLPDKYVFQALADAFLFNANKTMADEILEQMAKKSTIS